MRASLLPVLAVAAALALAGCITSAPASEPVEEPTPTAAPPTAAPPPVDNGTGPSGTITFPFAGKITLGLGMAQAGYMSPAGAVDGQHVWDVEVQPGAKGLVAELVWENTAHDLDLLLDAPGCDRTVSGDACHDATGGNAFGGDSPARLVVLDPAEGTWTLGVWAKNAVDASFEAYVTVFYDEAPPAEFSALQP